MNGIYKRDSMGLFSKKPTFALSEILKGLQQAVSSATGMLQAQQVDNLSHFWVEGGKPVTQNIQIGERNVEVPLVALVPHSNLAMDDVEIKFKARIGEVSSHSMPNALDGKDAISHAELQMNMEGIKADADDVMEITIRFKVKDTPEGVARLMDEYNKQI